ncbi:MAG TPA: hypothetical protein VGF18_04955 [Candidatus Tumulicola sp.]|jgi:hypothetical protein
MAIVGISDHGGWAIFVTANADGSIVDRRRVELIDDDLPALPHHHEGQSLPAEEAIALVDRVRASAERHASLALDEVARTVPGTKGIALRAYQPLPATTAERLRDYRARNVADWVMYRRALAGAAEARGWSVHFYDPKNVFALAASVVGARDVDAYFSGVRKIVGAPWNADHRLAFGASLAASGL